jgi:hydroxymethylpyrimidine/phosphomethylpyrimidine kinase
MKIVKVLTIAGSDCSGGAGVQADLKTFAAHGVYGMSVITALTAQNTCGVSAIHDVPADFVGAQLEAIFSDILPDAVKIGMLSNAEIIRIVNAELVRYNYTRKQFAHIIVDPVMVSTSGSNLISEKAAEVLAAELFVNSTLVTPNIPEAEKITGMRIVSADDMVAAAKKICTISGSGSSVLIKGGHSKDNADDLLYTQGKAVWIEGERIENPNTHGTGCTLSSAIACNLGIGFTLEDSVRRGKDYVRTALKSALDLGEGVGPLWHGHIAQ